MVAGEITCLSSVMPLGEPVDSILNQGRATLLPAENGPDTEPTVTVPALVQREGVPWSSGPRARDQTVEELDTR